MNISLKIDISGVKQKMGTANLNRGRYELATQAHQDMTRYVPQKYGQLRRNSSVLPDGSAIAWVSPYAGTQYAGGFTTGSGKSVVFSNYTTPGTGPRWDEVAKARHIEEWNRAFVKGASL